jgi:hypothetical protein
MPTLPPPPAIKLTPADAAAIAKRDRKLMRAGRITHNQWAVLDCILWSCRNLTTGAIVVSFSGLQKLANVGRATVAGAVRSWSGSASCAGSSVGSGSSGIREASRAARRPVPTCCIRPATQSSAAEPYFRATCCDFARSTRRFNSGMPGRTSSNWSPS